MKNHSFIYNQHADSWNLSPFYDVTYSLNPLINYSKVKRALSISGKRSDITLEDLLKIADKHSVKSAKRIIERTINSIDYWIEVAHKNNIPEKIINRIVNDFQWIL